MAALLAGCERAPEPYAWSLPAGFPRPPVPTDNPMTTAKVELGRHLFYDTRLSVNGTTSCGTCHRQELAFTDGRAVARGATGEHHVRGSMSLTNVAYNTRLTWANPLMDSLEDQALAPLFGDTPVEMGLTGHEAEALTKLADDPSTVAMFIEAFPDEARPVTLRNVVRAIASFERTLISGDAPYDRYLAGDGTALSPAAARGMELFFSERLECFHCHGGFNFSDTTRHEGQEAVALPYHTTGLYDLDGQGSYPRKNRGLYEMTHDPADMGKFRAPSLRNIAVTAPYMHDGSIATLSEVLDHYAAGGRARNARTSIFVPGFILTAEEKADVLAFLESLTDEQFLTDPRFANPFGPTPVDDAPAPMVSAHGKTDLQE
jgi:cytochrome c peroxidase